jgi:hypothetical protein
MNFLWKIFSMAFWSPRLCAAIIKFAQQQKGKKSLQKSVEEKSFVATSATV